MCLSKKILSKVPSYLASGYTRYYPVSCGKCIECLKRDQKEWCFRMLQEYENTRSGVFVTLTYNDAYLPINSEGFGSLCYRDVQLFMKRLRKSYNNERSNSDFDNLRFWCCGEYGKRTGRPHYHLIIYGLKRKYWHLINKSWQHGFIYLGYNFNEKCINYVSKYVSKLGIVKNTSGIVGSDKWCDDRNVCRCFRHMSLGLGRKYVENRELINYHLNITDKPINNYSFVCFVNGKRKYSTPILECNRVSEKGDIIKFSLPRYYRRKIFEENNFVDFGKDKYMRDYKDYCYKIMCSSMFVNGDSEDFWKDGLSMVNSRSFDEIVSKENKELVKLQKSMLDKFDYSDLSQFELEKNSIECRIKDRVPILI